MNDSANENNANNCRINNNKISVSISLSIRQK